MLVTHHQQHLTHIPTCLPYTGRISTQCPDHMQQSTSTSGSSFKQRYPQAHLFWSLVQLKTSCRTHSKLEDDKSLEPIHCPRLSATESFFFCLVWLREHHAHRPSVNAIAKITSQYPPCPKPKSTQVLPQDDDAMPTLCH